MRVEIACRECGFLAETEVEAEGDVTGTAAGLGHFQAEQQRQHQVHAGQLRVTWVWEDSGQAMEFVEAILRANFPS